MTEEMKQSVEVFKQLLEAYHQYRKDQGLSEDYQCSEMEHWVMQRAHRMCRDREISWEVFGRVMDEAICW